jgi:hypothetical protein
LFLYNLLPIIFGPIFLIVGLGILLGSDREGLLGILGIVLSFAGLIGTIFYFLFFPKINKMLSNKYREGDTKSVVFIILGGLLIFIILAVSAIRDISWGRFIGSWGLVLYMIWVVKKFKR